MNTSKKTKHLCYKKSTPCKKESTPCKNEATVQERKHLSNKASSQGSKHGVACMALHHRYRTSSGFVPVRRKTREGGCMLAGCVPSLAVARNLCCQQTPAAALLSSIDDSDEVQHRVTLSGNPHVSSGKPHMPSGNQHCIRQLQCRPLTAVLRHPTR